MNASPACPGEACEAEQRLAPRSTCAACRQPLPLAVGPVLVHLALGVATTTEGRPVPLTCQEFAVLAALVRAGGAVVSRKALSALLPGRGRRQSDRVLDQHALALRRKLPRDADGEPLVQTVRNEGFQIHPAFVRPREDLAEADGRRRTARASNALESLAGSRPGRAP